MCARPVRQLSKKTVDFAICDDLVLGEVRLDLAVHEVDVERVRYASSVEVGENVRSEIHEVCLIAGEGR